MGGSVKDVQSKRELDNLISTGAPVILHFWASWCDASKHMDQVLSRLSTDSPHAHFLRVEAEEQSEISEAYSVSTVPFFVFSKDGKTFDTLEGADPSSLANKVAKIAGPTDSGVSASPATVLETVKKSAKETSDTLNKRLQQLIDSHSVMLFMKGSPEEPKCGFSRKVVDILKEEKVKFGTFDILSDNEVREGLKKYSKWPTYPQLYCKGELVGGCDIVIAMHESGELQEVFKEKGISEEETLEDRLRKLVDSSTVMLFMKGNPDAPRCGFSSKVVNALREEGVSFGSFDILTDEEVRQGLKAFSNWPTFPQLYYKGQLIGGCDIVMELRSNEELKSTLSE